MTKTVENRARFTVECDGDGCDARLQVYRGECFEAPRICSRCRHHPMRLHAVRKKHEQHLQQHRDDGDFDHIHDDLRMKGAREYSGKTSKRGGFLTPTDD